MKILISAQHLDGNDPDGFNSVNWVAALETEYREIATRYFPNAEIVVKIDHQKKCSGYTRAVCTEFWDDDDADVGDQSALKFIIEQAANALYDKRGNEFYE